MKQTIATISGWISDITKLLQTLVVLGIVLGILFEDYFGVIGNLSDLFTSLGEQGLAGLVALLLVVLWYKK
ncbi:MAG: hypothetical protein CBD58_02385 [bacterium TMED198]|nr:MAG: hypothetical protein CBD58_02385 [bacterium TMED198]|tara:strand:- start:233 stop:445 length:213 start_codon:yes stop_codon:yes gene_type:complete